jgi:TM2 domain-containing membrane protein YozV
MFLVYISPDLVLPIFIELHLCEGWGCGLLLIYSPFVLLASLIFFGLSKILNKDVVENELKNIENPKLLKKKLIIGVILLIVGIYLYLIGSLKFFLSKYFFIFVILGVIYILSSSINLVIYFKKKNRDNNIIKNKQ